MDVVGGAEVGAWHLDRPAGPQRLGAQTFDGQVSALLQKLKCKLKNKSVSRGVTELTLEVKVKKGRIEFMDAFTAADFVDSATLVEYNGTYS